MPGTNRRQPGEVPTVHLVLAPMPDAVPSAIRLRRLVKSLLRSYGFRLLRITPADAIDSEQLPPSAPPAPRETAL